MLDNLDKSIIALMQQDLPLKPEPYKEMAQSLGISQEELLCRLQSYRASGKIRKLGAVLRHRKVGYSANALCAWIVAPERMAEVGAMLAAEPYITHCYERVSRPGWPYTMYTMLHGHSRQECESYARDLAKRANLTDFVLFYSTKEWKKTSMRYFREIHNAERD